MKTPDDADEAALVGAVKEAMRLADDGHEPDAAIEKVARARGLGPGMVSVLCQSYNTGRQLSQMRGEKSAAAKFASFPLANPAAVIAAIFGERTKAACAAPPDAVLRRRAAEHQAARDAAHRAVKRASEPAPPVARSAPAEPQRAQRRAYGRFETDKRAYEEARRQVSVLEDGLRAAVADLHSKMSGGPPLHVLEAVALNKYGSVVRPLLDHLAGLPGCRRQKRAVDVGEAPIAEAVDFRRAPFSTLERCVQLGKAAAAARVQRDAAFAAAAKTAQDCGLPFTDRLAAESGAEGRRQPSSSGAEGSLLKEGFITSPAFGVAASNAAAKIIGDVPKTKADMIEDQWLALEDPDHHNQLRKIKAHAMLNSMLTDPDDPISGFEPEQVVQAFNEINQLAPRVSEQPAVMRPLLQRRLQGNVQPFEAKEIADIEKGVAATRLRTPSGGLLQDAPNSLLG